MTRRIFVDRLPETTHGEFLYCWVCGGEFSATKADYFWMPAGKPFTCSAGHRSHPLQLVGRQCQIVEVRP